MKDRFLVRYWVKGSKKYLNSNKLVYNDGTYTQVSTKQSPSGIYYSYILYDWNTSELIPEQCTGLKDKNGKLIYEGDIVREISKREPEWEEYVIAIKWGYCGFNLDSDDEFDFEVIGNIHENPDLLEQCDVEKD